MNEIVKITTLGFGGAFVGTVVGESSLRSGKKVFVREVLPGEVVEVEIQTEAKNFIEGKLHKILVTSSDRTNAPCPKFGACGGCDLQHMSIGAQRKAKLKMVQDYVSIQGGISPLEGIRLIGEELPPLNYRKRIALHLNERGELGFYRLKSGSVVAIDNCPIASNAINNNLSELYPLLSALCFGVGTVVFDEIEGEVFCILRMRAGYKSIEILDSAAFQRLREKVSNLVVYNRTKLEFSQYRFRQTSLSDNSFSHLGHFSQVNEQGNEVLIETVLKNMRGQAITEFFAGAGNFSLPLASAGKSVQAVEIDAALVTLGRARASQKNLSERVEFCISSAEKFIKKFPIRAAVLLDPPRAGAKALIENWEFSSIDEIVYVSCNLPTLTRDLKLLNDQGFSLLRIFVLDMFPQSHHVETVSVLARAILSRNLE